MIFEEKRLIINKLIKLMSNYSDKLVNSIIVSIC